MRKLNYLYRLAITGLCFAVFSVGSLVLGGVLFIIRFFLGNKITRKNWAQWLIHQFFRLLLTLLCRLGVMSVELKGEEYLRRCPNNLILANHPTFIDIVLILSQMRQADCVVKNFLAENLFFGGVLHEAGYIKNASPEELVEACITVLKQGRSLVMFPEGTRTLLEQPFKFLPGAAYIAVVSKIDILPVILTCDPPTLMKGQKWYHIPSRPFHMRLEVKPVIPIAEWVNLEEPFIIAARELNTKLENYFLGAYESARTRNQATHHQNSQSRGCET